MSKPPSLKDVAMAAEVDPSTASFVINGKGDKLRISRATQARILAAARQLGYQSPFRRLSDGSAQSEYTAPQNRQIGLILSLTSPVESLALIPGLEPTLFTAGYQLEVVTLPTDPAAIRERLLKLRFAGLICCRTVYSAVSAMAAGNCPTIVLWEGAGKAILNAISGRQFSVGSDADLGVTSKPITETPKPIPVSTPSPVVTPTPIPKPEPITMPVVDPIELMPVTVEDHAADTAATTENNSTPVVTEEERSAPVVTVPALSLPKGVSPVESSDQDTTPTPVVNPIELMPVAVDDRAADTAATTENNSIPVMTEEERSAPVVTVPALSLPKGVSPVEANDQDTIPEPEPTPAPVVASILAPEPEAPPPEPVVVLPPVVSSPPAPVTPVEPAPIIPIPAPVEVTPPTESPAAESRPTVDEPPITPDLPTSETDSQATDPAIDPKPPYPYQ